MKVIAAKTEEQKRTCYKMRYDVMCQELGWLSQDSATPEERDEYDKTQSINFLVLDDNDNPIGTTRMIMEGDIPLPIEKHFNIDSREQMNMDHGRIILAAEGSRFIVPQNSEYRHHEVSVTMCNAIVEKSQELGVSHVFVSADHKVFRLLRMIGLPLKQIGEAKYYMGSKTVPSIFSPDKCTGKLSKSRNNKQIHVGG